MITVAVLLAAVFVVGCTRWFMNWVGDRIHADMIHGLEQELRSRTPDGSAQTGSRLSPHAPLPDRAGVECSRIDTPPAPSTLVGAAGPRHAAPTRTRIVVSHIASVGAAGRVAAAPTGFHRGSHQ